MTSALSPRVSHNGLLFFWHAFQVFYSTFSMALCNHFISLNCFTWQWDAALNDVIDWKNMKAGGDDWQFLGYTTPKISTTWNSEASMQYLLPLFFSSMPHHHSSYQTHTSLLPTTLFPQENILDPFLEELSDHQQWAHSQFSTHGKAVTRSMPLRAARYCRMLWHALREPPQDDKAELGVTRLPDSSTESSLL